MALQDLINASTGICQLDAETYTSTAPLIINRPMVIQGKGQSSTLVIGNLNQDIFRVTTNKPVVFRDFTITTTSPTSFKTNGYGIKFVSTSLNYSSRIENMAILNQWISVGMLNSYIWVIRDSYIAGSELVGIEIANPISPDSGDSAITNCVMDSTTTTGHAIYQRSGGGLKVIGNKILRHGNGYAMAMEAATSVLVFSGNSLEASHSNAIFLTPNGGSFSLVTITGNEIAVSTDGCGIRVAGSTWVDKIVVTGNVGSIDSGGTFISASIPNLINANNMVM